MKLNIPSCLHLSDFEKNEAQSFANRMYKKHKKAIHAAAEECCTFMSSFYFEVTYTSIGDQILICYGEEKHMVNDPELF